MKTQPSDHLDAGSDPRPAHSATTSEHIVVTSGIALRLIGSLARAHVYSPDAVNQLTTTAAPTASSNDTSLRDPVLARTVFRSESAEPLIQRRSPSETLAPATTPTTATGGSPDARTLTAYACPSPLRFPAPQPAERSVDAPAIGRNGRSLPADLPRPRRRLPAFLASRPERLHFPLTRGVRGPSQLFNRWQRPIDLLVPVVGPLRGEHLDGPVPAGASGRGADILRLPPELAALLLPSPLVRATGPDGSLVRSHTRRGSSHGHSPRFGGLAS